MDNEDLRLAVHHHLAGTGRAPVNAAPASVFAVDQDEIVAGLEALDEERQDQNGGQGCSKPVRTPATLVPMASTA